MTTRKPAPGLNRKQALSAMPLATPAVSTERKEGKLHVTVKMVRPRWQRWMGGDATCERTFGLDAFGQEIYNACDGSTPVTKMIKTFSQKHHINYAEAELNVTSFLKTLIGKGLVGVPLPDQASAATEGTS